MGLIRSLFARVVDALRSSDRAKELVQRGQSALRELLLPPHVAEQERRGALEDATGTPTAATSRPKAPDTRLRDQNEDRGGEGALHLERLSQLARDAGIANGDTEDAAIDPPAPIRGEPDDRSIRTEPVSRGEPRPPEDDAAPDESTRAEVAKFELGPHLAEPPHIEGDLDRRLQPFPEGYGDRRVFLLPRGPEWLLAQWDFLNDQKNEARGQGGSQLGLRLYELEYGGHRAVFREYACEELARQFYLPVIPDRCYEVELGYWTDLGHWLPLGRSADAWSPPNSVRPGRVVFATIPYERPRAAANGGTRATPAWRDALSRRSPYPGVVRSSLTPELVSTLLAARRALRGDRDGAGSAQAPLSGPQPMGGAGFIPASSPTSAWGSR